MNLKSKKKKSAWHELLHKKFVVAYIALAIVLAINWVVFSYLLTDREKASAFSFSYYGSSVTNLGNQTVAAGTNDVTLAEFFLTDPVLFNDNVACGGAISGNPCLTTIDADGAGSAGVGADDDNITYNWQGEPQGRFWRNNVDKDYDKICYDDETTPTCIYYEPDLSLPMPGQINCPGLDGDEVYIIGSLCAAASDLAGRYTGWSHMEIINTDDPVDYTYDFCGGSNSPGCANNISSTLYAENSGVCGGVDGLNWESDLEPIWDDAASGDGNYTPGVDLIYWDPSDCLTTGPCSGGCIGTKPYGAGPPVTMLFLDGFSCNGSISGDGVWQYPEPTWDDMLSGDGVYTPGIDTLVYDIQSCLALPGVPTGAPVINPEEYTETLFINNSRFDQQIGGNVESPSCYTGEDWAVDCDGADSPDIGYCDPISSGDALIQLTGNEHICTQGLGSVGNIYVHIEGYTTPCDGTGTYVSIRGGTVASYVDVGTNWSYRESNGISGWQIGEDLYRNPFATDTNPGTVYDGPLSDFSQGDTYPSWPSNAGFVDSNNTNNFDDNGAEDPVIIDYAPLGEYNSGGATPDIDVFSRGGLTDGDPITDFNAVGDLIYINGIDDSLPGDTLYLVEGPDGICTDNHDLSLAQCVYTDDDGNCDPGDGTIVYLLGAGCGDASYTVVEDSDNWSVSNTSYDATTDFLKEEGPNPLEYDLNGRGNSNYNVYYVDLQNPGFDCADTIYEDEGNINTGPVSQPGNGVFDIYGEVLNSLALKNIGSAQAGRDITNLRLFVDVWWLHGLGGDSDGRCGQPGGVGDDILTTFSPQSGNMWVSNATTETILAGLRACIIGDIAPTAIDRTTIKWQFPKLLDINSNGLYNEGDEGMFYYSNNDGLTDSAYNVPYTINISSPNKLAGLMPDNIAPADVQNVQIFASASGTVSISWQDPADEDLAKVIITETIGDKEEVREVTKGEQIVLLTGKKVGNTYAYLIKAQDGNGLQSPGLTYQVTIPAQGESSGTEIGEPGEIILPLGINVGDIIKGSESSAVYYIGVDKRKHWFANELVYNTWKLDFSGLKIVADNDLEQITLGSEVNVREGTYLVKKADDPKVYAIEPGGVLRWIENEQIARSLYGPDWPMRVVDLAEESLSKYVVGQPISSAIHPTGSLLTYKGSTKVYLIDSGYKREVTAEVFSQNNFQIKFIAIGIEPELSYPNGETMIVVAEIGYLQ